MVLVRKLCRNRGVVMDLLLRSPSPVVWHPTTARFARRVLTGAGNPWASSRPDASSRIGFLAARGIFQFGRMDGARPGGDGRKSFSKLGFGEGPYQSVSTGGDGGGGGGGGEGGPGDRYTGGGGPGDGEQPGGSTGGWRNLMAWYMMKLEEHPVRTKALTAGILNVFGDLLSQVLMEKKEHLDLKRSAMFFLIGLALVGPALHYWYSTLNRVITLGGPKGAALRLVCDQLAFAPVFIAAFFTVLLTLEGRPSDIGPKLHQDWSAAVLTNWKIWVPFQFLNFLFVPPQLQVAASNVIALGWNMYLSYSSHKEVEHTAPSPAA